MLSLEMTKAVLVRLSLTYTERKKDFEDSRIANALAMDYHRDMIDGGITTARQLGDAIVQGRKTWQWFPKPEGILRAHSEVCQSRKQILIPSSTTWHDPTPREIERNKKLVSLAVQAVMGKISFPECERRQNEIIDKKSTI